MRQTYVYEHHTLGSMCREHHDGRAGATIMHQHGSTSQRSQCCQQPPYLPVATVITNFADACSIAKPTTHSPVCAMQLIKVQQLRCSLSSSFYSPLANTLCLEPLKRELQQVQGAAAKNVVAVQAFNWPCHIYC